MIVKVIMPDVDPHPESYGHYVLKRSFADALGWESLDRYTISFDANGGSGSMADRVVTGVDGMPVHAEIHKSTFTPPTEYHFIGWNTKADGSGNSYVEGERIRMTGDVTLYAIWSNEYTLTYRHVNKTNLYGDDETGHMECYALYINGQEMPDLGMFSDNNAPVYTVAKNSTIRVVVSHYKANSIAYKDADCGVYMNGSQVASGTGGTEYTFTLTGDTTVEFQWKIAGSLVTLNAKSWEDCYITTS